MGRAGRIVSAALAVAALAGAAGAAGGDKVPYWASISAREAMMRSGPGPNYPAVWKYVRPGLPLKVIARHEHWRRVVEPDGTQGWMNGVLLSDERTAVVTTSAAPMRDVPDSAGRIVWRAAPGVIGKITRCAGGWCKFDAGGRVGYIEIAHIWGADANEADD
jgi:SH3-like domain-containing protein